MKIVLEGEFEISEEGENGNGNGKSVRAGKGDVFFFPKGAVITFKTDTGGLAFYTGQRKEGAA